MITFDDKMKKLPPKRRAKIEAKTQELLQKMQIIIYVQLLVLSIKSNLKLTFFVI